jgi:hypothetical protein
MLGSVRTVGSCDRPEVADREGVSWLGAAAKTVIGPHLAGRDHQAMTHAPSWRARPSASSRRRLTTATRSDHHRSLCWIPR